MKLTKEVILERYQRTEDNRADYVRLANEYEQMWRGNPGFRTTREQALEEGREQIVLPIPFNVVNLSERLLSSRPRINVVPVDAAAVDAKRNAEAVERWLTAFWTRINRDMGRNVLADVRWYALTLGRFAMEIKWVEEALPKLRRKTHLPISVRALDPRNVGYWHNSLYTEWVYHTYTTSLLEVLRRYPELRKADSDTRLGTYLANLDRDTGHGEDVEVTVVDYWYISEKDGAVWNAILVEDEFAKEPMETDYPDLPIFVGRGDFGVGLGDAYDGLSILHPLRNLWQYMCRLVSQMGTGLLWHFWPAITIESAEGENLDVEIGPGIQESVPEGTKVNIHSINPNVPLAETMYRYIDSTVQQSTYPNVMYGQEPGSLQAGYGISLLSDAASGRIKNFAESLEMAVSYASTFVLALLDTFGSEEGLSISYFDERNKEPVTLKLTKEMISGNYENHVKIRPRLPSDDQARLTLAMQMNSQGKLSDRTFWDEYLDIQVPTDEEDRIVLEQALKSDPLTPWRYREALRRAYGPERTLSILYDTELMPQPPPGFHWMRDDPDGPVYLMPDSQMGGSELPGMPPMEMPPDMPPGMPGMPPGMMEGMPPDMMGGGPLPLQPEAMQGPMGGNLMAPAMAGMLEPEMLGLPPQGDPLTFQRMVGNPMTPQEEIDMLLSSQGQ